MLYGGGKGDNLSGLLSGPTQRLTGLTPAQRRLARQYAQAPNGYDKLRNIPIPVGDPNKPALVRFHKASKGTRAYLDIQETHVIRRFYAFQDFETDDLLVTDDAGELIDRIVKKTKKRKQKRMWKLACGKHQSLESYDDAQIRAKVRDVWVNPKYQEQEKWATGVIAFSYRKPQSWTAYANRQEDERTKALKAAKKIRLSVQPRKRKKRDS